MAIAALALGEFRFVQRATTVTNSQFSDAQHAIGDRAGWASRASRAGRLRARAGGDLVDHGVLHPADGARHDRSRARNGLQRHDLGRCCSRIRRNHVHGFTASLLTLGRQC
jgi:hypothetical protein